MVVGDARVVVDHCVHERNPDFRAIVLGAIAALTGALRGVYDVARAKLRFSGAQLTSVDRTT